MNAISQAYLARLFGVYRKIVRTELSEVEQTRVTSIMVNLAIRNLNLQSLIDELGISIWTILLIKDDAWIPPADHVRNSAHELDHQIYKVNALHRLIKNQDQGLSIYELLERRFQGQIITD